MACERVKPTYISDASLSDYFFLSFFLFCLSVCLSISLSPSLPLSLYCWRKCKITYFSTSLLWHLKIHWVIIKSSYHVHNITFSIKYSRVSIVRDCLDLLKSSDHTYYDNLEHTITCIVWYRHCNNTHYICELCYNVNVYISATFE